MSGQPIDLRSDAVTHPTDEMRDAMRAAELGKYQDHEDPTVRELERRCAELFGKEAAVFLPSATMANLIACMHYCNPGDQAIVDQDSHVYRNEFSGMTRVGGIMPRAVPRSGAVPDVHAVERAISHRHAAENPVRLLWIENTHNVGGGAVASAESLAALRSAVDQSIAIHVDGARIFNASVAHDIALSDLCRNVNSVSVGFNKALACPVGCVLVGSQELIDTALRLRRMFGGRFTKGGVLAAACNVALRTMVDRLADDHDNARRLGEVIESVDGLRVESPIETNIVRFDTSGLCPAQDLVEALNRNGVLVGAVGPTVIRAVTHHHITADQIAQVAGALDAALDSVQASAVGLSAD